MANCFKFTIYLGHNDTFIIEMINKYWLLIALVLLNNANAYIPDRCDWQDCEALANGESSGYGLLALIVIGVVLYIANRK